MPKVLGVCVLALWLATGCSDDDKVGDAGIDGGTGGMLGGDGDGDGTGGTVGDGDGDGDPDAGDGDGDGDGDGTGGLPGGDGTGGNVGSGGGDPIDNGFPHDGAQLSTCFRDDDCKGDLKCQQANGNGEVGYCTGTCQGGNDKDCADIDGLQTTCGPGGECRIDCSPGGTDGACPTDFECASTFGGDYCAYPADAGAVKPAWDACDSDLSECGPDLTCTRQSLLGLPSPGDLLFGTAGGFCTSTCSSDDDCKNDGGAGGTAACTSMGGFTRYCIIECEDDKDCPGDMQCLFTGLLSPKVCGF